MMFLFVPIFVLFVNAALSSSSNGVHHVFHSIINDGDMIFDMNTEQGENFMRFAVLVGGEGSIVGMEENDVNFKYLKSRVLADGLWDRTLLVNANPNNYTSLLYYMDAEFEGGLNSITEVFNMVGQQCPNLIHINGIISGSMSDNPIHMVSTQYSVANETISAIVARQMPVVKSFLFDPLLSSTDVLDACSPFIYLTLPPESKLGQCGDDGFSCRDSESHVIKYAKSSHVDAVSSLPAITQLLTSKYQLFLHSSSSDNKAIGVLAVSSSHTSNGELSGRIGSLLKAKVLTVLDSDHPLMVRYKTSSVESYHTTYELDGSVMFNTFTMLRCALSPGSSAVSVLCSKAIHDQLTAHLATHPPLVIFDSTLSPANMKLLANAKCLLWTRKLFTFLDGMSEVLTTPDHERVKVFESCRLASYYRLGFTLKMLLKRTEHLQLTTSSAGGEASRARDRTAAMSSTIKRHSFYITAGSSASGFDSLNTTDYGSDNQHMQPTTLISDLFTRSKPLESKYDHETCAEPVWCSHTIEMQRRIALWQTPESHDSQSSRVKTKSDYIEAEYPMFGGAQRTCEDSKFLVFEPPSELHGIGSMLMVIAAAFRYAICLDRIFVLSPLTPAETFSKWKFPGCHEHTNAFECYFQPVHGCHHALNFTAMKASHHSQTGDDFEAYPLRNERYLVLRGLPQSGKCALCFSDWPQESKFFDGLMTGGQNRDYGWDAELFHMSAFTTSIKATYISQFLRYVLRPWPWLSELLREVTQLTMFSPEEAAASLSTEEDKVAGLLPSEAFPKQFASLHVRYGMKYAEATLQPITRYMDILAKKLPWVKDVFVSTETEAAIVTLVENYPQYRFHYLRYERQLFLDLFMDTPEKLFETQDFAAELLFSLANLHVASEATGFVGTLSSNWCMAIMHMERTRGDGGYDYLSADLGSAWTSCL